MKHRSPVKKLSLAAMDRDDLAVFSASLQDAVVRVGDIAYLQNTRRFALAVSRFDWLALESGRKERAATGLHFDRVLDVQQTGIAQSRPDEVLSLLTITYEETTAPAGIILLVFSGGAAIRLHVECIEAQMHDLGPRWRAQSRPDHPPDAHSAKRS